MIIFSQFAQQMSRLTVFPLCFKIWSFIKKRKIEDVFRAKFLI